LELSGQAGSPRALQELPPIGKNPPRLWLVIIDPSEPLGAR
jgi:hypothetical protein